MITLFSIVTDDSFVVDSSFFCFKSISFCCNSLRLTHIVLTMRLRARQQALHKITKNGINNNNKSLILDIIIFSVHLKKSFRDPGRLYLLLH